ncbi:hypothetical protein [Rummeliibacillus sp. TYF-LIM-RU47]|uniref:hypothetical protein n=1 Tax=Rummeliibacillus sp. TYF-LIM-RU47 TaxID=2608406 RepID=UPI00123A73A6|nr:hypothetical protein [Rummeliibacillus sp. TYF-LIM-RU47]
MTPTFIGFNQIPYALIFWLNEDCDMVNKTVCYDEQDVQDMLAKHKAPVGLYSEYSDYILEYHESVGRKAIC